MEFMKIQKERLEKQQRLYKKCSLWKTKRIVERKVRIISVEKEQGNTNSFSRDSVIYSIGEFKYCPEKEVTFSEYFRYYEKVFNKRLCYIVGRKENTSVARDLYLKRTRKVC